MAETDTIDFDFVLDSTLRNSLKSDLKEMDVAYKHEAWKACMVLGGSIVEALLLDYLLAEKIIVDYEEAAAMSFDKLISNAWRKRIISERVKEQAYLIKRYRNLIHQGRTLRTREPCDRHSAMTTLALVNMVISEVSEKRREAYGLNADQFCKKVISDPANRAVLAHLVKTMRPGEVERLLCDVLVSAAFEHEPLVVTEYDPFEEQEIEFARGNRELFSAVLRAHRFVFDQASEDIKGAVMASFAKTVREEPQKIVDSIIDWFVLVRDLRYAPAEDLGLLADYLIDQIRPGCSMRCLHRCRRLGSFLNQDQITLFFDRMIGMTVSASEDIGEQVWQLIVEECTSVDSSSVPIYKRALETLRFRYDYRGEALIAERLENVAVEEEYDPFKDE